MSLMGYALRAASRGFHIFPVEPLDKTPGRIYPNRSKEDAPWTIKWSERATDWTPSIVNWWNECPQANIGIACAPSGLLVVDCDLKQSDGLEEFSDMCAKYGNGYEDWKTYTVNTGSGGAHFYYRWPAYVQASQGSIAKSVDIRSNGGQKGGYVLAQGSVTVKGSYEVDNDGPVMQAPEWLFEICREDRPKQLPRPVSTYERPDVVAFYGLADSIRYAPEGNRNNCLLWCARSMCSDGADIATALEILVPVAVDNGLTEREATDSIESAYRLQRQKDGR